MLHKSEYIILEHMNLGLRKPIALGTIVYVPYYQLPVCPCI